MGEGAQHPGRGFSMNGITAVRRRPLDGVEPEGAPVPQHVPRMRDGDEVSYGVQNAIAKYNLFSFVLARRFVHPVACLSENRLLHVKHG